MKNLIYVFTGLLISLVSCNTNKGQWENLIKKDLSNWAELNGTAPYVLNKGEITGTTVLDSPNSFLCTTDKYGDFILEFDAWINPKMNSGVQVRSESRPDYQNGRVHGYQVELESSPRAWSGGIFDEGRRGWLYPLDRNPAGQKAFKINEWNHVRVEAIGNSIRTWLNGVPCADIIDDMTPSGFIGLQVHSIGKDTSRIGEMAKWKNIRIMTRDVEKFLTLYEPLIIQRSFLINKLSEYEVKEGWKLLWDGKTTNGWRGAKLTGFPEHGWEIKDGILTVSESGKNKSVPGGDIITTDKFKNFELILDFRYAPGANSGIKYFVDTGISEGKGSSIGCEYQILDDRLHPDAKLGINGNRTLAGLYDLIPPKPKNNLGPGVWNRAMIIVNGNHVEHFLNGQMTLAYERGDNKWRELVATSKFKGWPNFGEAGEGRILLQDHGNEVSFRSIKIREIKD